MPWLEKQLPSPIKLVFQTSQFRILHLVEKDNLSPLDSKIACLCQSIKINNKHVYHHSQVRKPISSEVKWAECSLITDTGCWVFVWSSIAQSVCEWTFSLLAIWCLRPPRFESCIQQRKTTCLHSIRKSLACARPSKLTTTNVYITTARSDSQSAVKSRGLNARSSKGQAIEFKFLLDPRKLSRFVSVHSVCWLFGVSDIPASNTAFSKGRPLVSFRFEINLPVPEHHN